MKRFTETTKWSDPWFRKLKPEYKAFWEYVRDSCDCAGVWVVDMELASYLIGVELASKEILGAFENRIRDIGNGRWWIVKFVPFQYGELSESCKPHLRIIKSLEEHRIRIPKGYPKGIHTLEEEDKEKEEDKEGESRGGGKRPKPKSQEEVTAFCRSISLPENDASYLWNKWVGNGFINAGKAMRDWQAVIRSWRDAGHLPSQKGGNSNGKYTGNPRSDGTANAGVAASYANVGRSIPKKENA